MSFWDRYLAPGDVRNATGSTAIVAPVQTVDRATQTAPSLAKPARLDAAARSRRQNGLLIGGAVFTALSVLITRRAVAKKIQSAPAMEAATGATQAMSPKIAGGLDAAEALGFATLNVFSVGLLAMGGAMKILDIADVEDLREKVRRGIGYDVYGGDAKADKELEEWVSELLTNKDGSGLKKGLVDKLAELETLAKNKPKD